MLIYIFYAPLFDVGQKGEIIEKLEKGGISF